MRVANYYNNSDVRIEERPVPKIGAGELLLRTRSAGICGSDVMEWYRAGKAVRVLGHEISGEIVEVGQGITQYKVGDRIAASHHVPCFECHFCRLGHHTLCDMIHQTNFDPGGFAEWIRLPKINVQFGVYRLPDAVSFEEATLIEPLACVVRGQEKAAVRGGQTVLIMGCGPAGLLHVALAKNQGVERIIATDVVPFRLETAKRFGADRTFLADELSPQKLRKENEGRLADVVITCVGVEKANQEALTSVDRGGTVLFFAPVSQQQHLNLQLNDLFWQRGVTLMSSYAASPENHRIALDLIQSGKIRAKEFISHRLGLSEIQAGFDLVVNAKDSLKVVLDPAR
ncbi:MAG: alcohol dehydrogenase catalytic domain-containing protein [Deltaproteobacteria bacterium]|nr:alcohol dehydrogenase catalytic domain-containing protein [Deltaproteobacteria bacterium]